MSTFNFTNNEERTNNNTTTKLICDFGGEHGDKVGFKNENGELVIPYKYDDAMQYEVENEPIVVKLNNKWGFVDCNGNALSDFKYDEIKSLKEAMKVRIGDKWGVEVLRETIVLTHLIIFDIAKNITLCIDEPPLIILDNNDTISIIHIARQDDFFILRLYNHISISIDDTPESTNSYYCPIVNKVVCKVILQRNNLFTTSIDKTISIVILDQYSCIIICIITNT